MKVVGLVIAFALVVVIDAQLKCLNANECTENVSPGVPVRTCTRPVNGATASMCFTILGNGQRVNFIADERNAGFYWQCISRQRPLLPCPCSLGTRVSSLFFMGQSNPCSKNLNVHNFLTFDYTRKDLNIAPCVQTPEFTCKNGGTYTNLDEKCWCLCAAGFTDVDCGQTVGPPPELPAYKPCSEELRQNYCLSQPCLNGGRCENQCGNFFCHCVGRFTAGKRCERYNCREEDCLNGGTCDRGPDGSRAWAECTCLPGYTGAMCEIKTGA